MPPPQRALLPRRFAGRHRRHRIHQQRGVLGGPRHSGLAAAGHGVIAAHRRAWVPGRFLCRRRATAAGALSAVVVGQQLMDDVQFGGRTSAAASVAGGRLAARRAEEETGQVLRHARQATVVAGHAKHPYTSRS